MVQKIKESGKSDILEIGKRRIDVLDLGIVKIRFLALDLRDRGVDGLRRESDSIQDQKK